MNEHETKNHSITATTYQKYYSALKSLSELGLNGDLFDDVSKLDNFFSEFRNITFVIQKGLETDADKTIYLSLREKYLSDETSKWFVETRNKSTKEKPFPLKKVLRVKIFLGNEVIEIDDKLLSVDLDKSFQEVVSALKSILIRIVGFTEIDVSTSIIFSEDEKDIDVYPRIQDGVVQMSSFINELGGIFECNCSKCSELKKRTQELTLNIMSKPLLLTHDYSINTETVSGEISEVIFVDDQKKPFYLPSYRMGISGTFFDNGDHDPMNIFKRFVIMHVLCYKEQDYYVMPVFMILYTDKTFRIIPFSSNVKATFYRKVNEIASNENFEEIEAVFYCGEYYVYDHNSFELEGKVYSERIKHANKELLAFTIINRDEIVRTVSFEKSEVDNFDIVLMKIKNPKSYIASSMSWFEPIKLMFQRHV